MDNSIHFQRTVSSNMLFYNSQIRKLDELDDDSNDSPSIQPLEKNEMWDQYHADVYFRDEA